MAFGFVLRNVMQDSYDPYRYYYAHNYNTVFEKPIVVNNVDDLNYVQELLQDVNFAEYSVQHRNDTKWKIYRITNVTFFATLLRDVPLGCKRTLIPEFLLDNNRLLTLTHDPSTKLPYNDNLCVIRALAAHSLDANRSTQLEEKTEWIFYEFCHQVGCIDPAKFGGVKEE